MVIVIDPGHGGRDPGAVSHGVREADITFNVASLVQRQLNQLLPDAVTLLTRTQATIDLNAYKLQSRVELANSQRAACFVSIHCNASVNEAANGLETFYFTNSISGEHLALILHRRVLEAIRINDRGVKASSRLYVLRHTRMPASLIELGFITNPEDRAMLVDPNYQRLYAEAIANGIVEFVHSIRAK